MSPRRGGNSGFEKTGGGSRNSGVSRSATPERRFLQRSEGFRCGHCGMTVGEVIFGGHHRNHCPYCLYSRHVDAGPSGDRRSTCGGLMEPIGYFLRGRGEHAIVHRCLTCGFERYNRIAGDDNFDLVERLPEGPPRGPAAESKRRPNRYPPKYTQPPEEPSESDESAERPAQSDSE